jgi:hypothetical protein
MKTNLEILREARALLAEHYVKWARSTSDGGHCALGCLDMASGVEDAWTYPEQAHMLDAAARRMHPELAHPRAECPHFIGSGLTSVYDDFENSPIVFINDHLGKDAALAVFDDAILHEEMREMLANVKPEQEPKSLSEFVRETSLGIAAVTDPIFGK